jgi:hypothetical protein
MVPVTTPPVGTPSPVPPPPARPGPPLLVRRAVFIGVLALVALSVAVTLLVGFRPGGYVLAAATLAGAVCRAVLPEYLCLGLLVRSRRQDVVTLLVIGVALAVSVSIVPGH